MKHPGFKIGISLLFVFITGIKAQAQVTVAEVNGQPVIVKNYVDIEGSPYLFDDWVQGSVKLANGSLYNNVALKYNQLDGHPLFRNKTGEAYEFTDAVAEFTLDYKNVTKHFITNVSGPTDKAFYETIGDGKTRILKHSIKYIQEIKEYNSATGTKKFKGTEKYFLQMDGKLIPIKNDKKAILAALGKKQPELETYIKSNHLDLKEDGDLADLIIYYNSL
jgi:hypothetical protein